VAILSTITLIGSIMFSNTITLNIDSVDRTLVKVNQDKYSGEYRLTTDTGDRFTLSIRHSTYVSKTDKVSYDRHNYELSYIAVPDDNGHVFRSKGYFVLEVPSNATSTAAHTQSSGMVSFLTGSGNVDKIANWES